MVYQYDDAGEPISLTPEQLRFKELWRHVEMLDLPELNPAMQVDTPTFDPALFFQRLSWAHAELGVMMELLDSILDKRLLSVQAVSNHSDSSSRQSPLTTGPTINEECVLIAKDIFQKAYSHSKETSEDLPALKRLSNLRDAGWPLIRIGADWHVNYGYQSLLNLPLDPSCIVPIDGSGQPFNWTAPKLLRISRTGIAAESITLGSMLAGDSILATLLMSSIDTAIFRRLLSISAKNLSRLSMDSFEIDGLVYELHEGQHHSSLTIDPELLGRALSLYKNFIVSCGELE